KSSGEADYFISVVDDISDRKQAEAKIKTSLREKEFLLKEIHHRVKNNLYVISNLLELQSSTIKDEAMVNLFSDCQNRIQAMALIHHQLYQAENLSAINFADYLLNLLDNLFFSHQSLQKDINCDTSNIESLYIHIETAIPCGLLVNELVTNSFKYAFSNQETGEIKIQLYHDRNHQVHLVVSDNGIGLPADLDWQNCPSLGLTLVKILAEQLEATIELDNTHGATFHLSFFDVDIQQLIINS
ncbi:MAG: histidine kinase dimerization/phosphoacceptor domain -containing protein, partial [Microcoleaceae cyanobacterium]